MHCDLKVESSHAKIKIKGVATLQSRPCLVLCDLVAPLVLMLPQKTVFSCYLLEIQTIFVLINNSNNIRSYEVRPRERFLDTPSQTPPPSYQFCI